MEAFQYQQLSSTTISLLALGVSTLWLSWRLVFRPRSEAKKPFENLPMPPNSHWLVGHYHLYKKILSDLNPGKELLQDYWDDYGRVGLWIGPRQRYVVLTQTEDVRTVLATEYLKRTPLLAKPHIRKFKGENAMAGQHGRVWKASRNAVLRSVTPAALEGMEEGLSKVVEIFVESLKGKHFLAAADNNSPKKTLEIEPLMRILAFDSFTQGFLNDNQGSCENLEVLSVASALDFLQDEFIRRLKNPLSLSNWIYAIPTHLNQRHYRERTLVTSYLRGLIDNKYTGIEEQGSDAVPHDVLFRLILEASSSDSDDKLGRRTLEDTLRNLFFAGYHSTSLVLTYSLYLIAKNPESESICLKEIRQSLAKNDGKVSPSDLVYCKAVLLETLRLFPPATSMNRYTQKPITLARGNFTIPAGTNVLVLLSHIQRSEANYTSPDEFLPERWVKQKSPNPVIWEDIPNVATLEKSFLAFSVGARACPGANFANHQFLLTFAQLLDAFKFETISADYVVKPILSGVVHRPHDNMPMKISVRND